MKDDINKATQAAQLRVITSLLVHLRDTLPDYEGSINLYNAIENAQRIAYLDSINLTREYLN